MQPRDWRDAGGLVQGTEWASLTLTGPGTDAFWNIPTANPCRIPGARGLYSHPGSTIYIYQSCDPGKVT